MSDQEQTNIKENGIRERNSETAKAHKKEVFWQITAPLIGTLVLFLAVSGLVIVAGTQGTVDVRLWGHISLIWLILPVLLIILVFLIVTGGLAYGVIKLIQVLPEYSYKLQKVLWTVRDRLRTITDTAAKPVIKVNSLQAALRTLLRK